MLRFLPAAALAATLCAAPAQGAVQQPRFSCDGDRYTLSTLRSPLGAERGASDAAAAFRRYLRSRPLLSDGTRLPRLQWRLLRTRTNRVTFGSNLMTWGMFTVVVERRGGRWVAGDPLECELERVGFTSFALAKVPRTTARRVRVGVDVTGCGTPRRVLGVRTRVRTTARSVTVLLRVRFPPSSPPPPGVACPQVAFSKTITIDLGQAIGRRALFDGSLRPKRLVLPRR